MAVAQRFVSSIGMWNEWFREGTVRASDWLSKGWQFKPGAKDDDEQLDKEASPNDIYD